ncbi:MAG: hypothetical protein R2932_33075 [Caldilineaceae bacterium]
MRIRLQPKAPIGVNHAGVTFLVGFLLLNCLLFLPLYLLNWEETTFLPLTMQRSSDWHAFARNLFVMRENFDPFRFNIELVLLIVLLVNIRWLRRPGLRLFFVLFYFLGLSYYIYEAITLSIYQSEPVFYNHYYMALDGLGYLFAHLNFAAGLYLLGALAVLLAVWLIYQLATLFYQSTISVQWNAWARFAFLGIGVVFLIAARTEEGALAAPTTVLSSLSYKVEGNIEKSLELYRQVASFDDSALQKAYDYSAYTLPRKPNLYFLFVESYGSVLYKRPDYRIDYSMLLKQLKRALDQAGWYSTSTLSEAPTWGGGSWLSYTSTQFGLRIDNHPYYLTLLNKYQHERYPHLGVFLQDQGYKSYRLSSLSVNLSQDSWDHYEQMYDVDGWYRFEDLNYHGPLYGWGPAAPDQYALNYARQQIIDGNDPGQPFMLFLLHRHRIIPLPPSHRWWRIGTR